MKDPPKPAEKSQGEPNSQGPNITTDPSEELESKTRPKWWKVEKEKTKEAVAVFSMLIK